MTDFFPTAETRVLPQTTDSRADETNVIATQPTGGGVPPTGDNGSPADDQQETKRPLFNAREWTPPKGALVVVVGMIALATAFIVMLFVDVTPASINALAVIATPIAVLVAAYYGITLSIQQVRSERAEKERAIARAEAADVASRESEVWAAQLEAGLRVAMVKMSSAGIGTDEVTKAAGTPDGFF